MSNGNHTKTKETGEKRDEKCGFQAELTMKILKHTSKMMRPRDWPSAETSKKVRGRDIFLEKRRFWELREVFEGISIKELWNTKSRRLERWTGEWEERSVPLALTRPPPQLPRRTLPAVCEQTPVATRTVEALSTVRLNERLWGWKNEGPLPTLASAPRLRPPNGLAALHTVFNVAGLKKFLQTERSAIYWKT